MSCRIAVLVSTDCVACATDGADPRAAFLAGLLVGTRGTETLAIELCALCTKMLDETAEAGKRHGALSG